jgi:hypothetical protein
LDFAYPVLDNVFTLADRAGYSRFGLCNVAYFAFLLYIITQLEGELDCVDVFTYDTISGLMVGA